MTGVTIYIASHELDDLLDMLNSDVEYSPTEVENGKADDKDKIISKITSKINTHKKRQKFLQKIRSK
jgi:hypothetical protein